MPEARYRTVRKKAARSTPVQRMQAVAVLETTEKPAAKPKSKQKPGASLVAWWPVAVGIFLVGFVSEWHQDTIEMGVWAERLLFPFTLLAQRQWTGMSAQMAAILPQAALYLQLPLEGLVIKLTLDRSEGLKNGVALVLMIHIVCAAALWLLAPGH